MKIGIIGTGNMGRALGVGWARAGHEVFFGSRDIGKAGAVAAVAGNAARAGDFDGAAAFGEVVLYTVRGVFPTSLLKGPEVLAGKILIDCNNTDVGNDKVHGEFHLDPVASSPPLADQLQKDVPAARVVKAFNTIPHPVIELGPAKLAPHRVSVFVCANDAQAKKVVKRLAEDLGFAAVDSGGLERARLAEGAADFLRFHIGPMGLGMLATLSIRVLAPGEVAP